MTVQLLVWEDIAGGQLVGLPRIEVDTEVFRDPPALALGHGPGLPVIGGSTLLPALWSHKKRGYSMEPKTLTTARCPEIPRNLSFTDQSCRPGAASSGLSLKYSK